MDQSSQYIFLVDYEPIQNEMLKDHIGSIFQYELKTYENGEDAIKDLGLNPSIVVLDFHLNSHLPDAQNGVEVLKRIKEISPHTEVIMLSGQVDRSGHRQYEIRCLRLREKARPPSPVSRTYSTTSLSCIASKMPTIATRKLSDSFGSPLAS